MGFADIAAKSLIDPHYAIEAYGDESLGDDLVVYALGVGTAQQFDAAEELLIATKWRHGVDDSERLHCRELFAGDRRKKSGWAHLTTQELFPLFADLTKSLKAIGVEFVIVVAARGQFPPIQPALPPFPEILGGKRQLAVFCANAAVMPLLTWFGHERFKFWPDPDLTHIPWLGQNRQTMTIPGTMFGGEGGFDQVIHGIVGATPKPAALEIADYVAYFALKSLSRPQSRFKRDYKRIYMEFDAARVNCIRRPQDGGLSFNYPGSYGPRGMK